MSADRSLFLLLMALLVICCPAPTRASDPDAPRLPRDARLRYGICMAPTHSLLRANALPYFLPNGSGTAVARVRNSPGFSGGIFLYAPVFRLRFSVELHLLPAEMVFPIGRPNELEKQIYPATVEVPVHWVSPPLFSGKGPSPVLGGRFTLPIARLTPEVPNQRRLMLSADIGLQWTIRLPKRTFDMGMMYSHSLFSAVDGPADHFTGRSLGYVGRHFIGIYSWFD